MYAGEEFIGTLDRRGNQSRIEIPAREKETTLKIVVDTFGHVNFSKFMEKDRKGIIGSVKMGEKELFLDMRGWQKGYVWVNGHLLGRYWNIGPQERLYCPGEILKNGMNTVEILDLFLVTDTPPPVSGKTERNMEVHKETKSLNNQW